MSDPVEQAQLIVDCELREEKLGDWERSFIDSLSRQLTDGRTLSAKQIERLEEIWEKVT